MPRLGERVFKIWKNHVAYHDGMAELLRKLASYHDDWFKEDLLVEAKSHLASAREAEENAWNIENSYRPLGRAKEKIETSRTSCMSRTQHHRKWTFHSRPPLQGRV